MSGEGNFIINQNDRNQKVFLVYVSENISDRLLKALSEAEVKALDLNPESSQVRNRLGIPKTLDILSIEPKENKTIQEKYRVDIEKSDINALTTHSKNMETDEREKI